MTTILRPTCKVLVLVSLIILGSSSGANATPFAFTTFDVSSALGFATSARGINDRNEVVGTFNTTNHLGTTQIHGFLKDADGNISQIDPPGADTTSAIGINANGEIVGGVRGRSRTDQGFLRNLMGAFTTIDVFGGSLVTVANGINDAGIIVGSFLAGTGITRAFRRASGANVFTVFDAPGAATRTVATDINNSGSIVGSFSDGSRSHGFLLSAPFNFLTLDFPGSISTTVSGISETGVIVGDFFDSAGLHGFLRNTDGTYTSLDVPGAGAIGTFASDIDSDGVIVGGFGDNTGVHGFFATPIPEPLTFILMGTGIAIFTFIRRHGNQTEAGY